MMKETHETLKFLSDTRTLAHNKSKVDERIKELKLDFATFKWLDNQLCSYDSGYTADYEEEIEID